MRKKCRWLQIVVFSPVLAGFFVYRHLGLLRCNIVLMKHSLPLLMLTGLLSGQNNKPLSVNSLSWLTGSWQGPIGDNLLEETWLPPRAGTIVALVRSTNDSSTQFVEIVHIEEVNGTLELQLQLFDNSLSPITPEVYYFELTKLEENYVSFKGIGTSAHRTLSYERPEKDLFYIRFQPYEGDAVEIRLTPEKY